MFLILFTNIDNAWYNNIYINMKFSGVRREIDGSEIETSQVSAKDWKAGLFMGNKRYGWFKMDIYATGS